jgi:2-amino-4-hydroxy-6-hydroxymethyldihydropteridine diphosphokinase
MPIAVLGLGSNLGDRERSIARALRAIGERHAIVDHSSIYETEPVGYEDQPRFLNMVVRIETGGSSAEELLRFAKTLEKEIGREESFRWGPRSIDVDILLIEGVVRESDELTVPHKELLKRNFALIPLSELQRTVTVRGREFDVGDLIRANANSGQGVSLYKRREELARES